MRAVIAGTGIYSIDQNALTKIIDTKYGKSSIEEIKLGGKSAIFLPRHGKKHEIPPHKINYRANISALKKIGVTDVLSIYSAGIISNFEPGDIVRIDDFIGLFTPATFYDKFDNKLMHKDFSNPFSNKISLFLNKYEIKEGGIIATTPGPRFETKAEIRFLKVAGANLVNMTSAYEISLLHEMEIEFASIAVAANFASGITDHPLNNEEVINQMKKSNNKVQKIISAFLSESSST